MEVILRQYVEHLGKRGDVVKVAAGYARNYLLPRKLALPATDGNKRHVERERKIMEVKEADEKAQASAIASRIEAIDVVITRRVGETDALYGSVTSADIAEYLKQQNVQRPLSICWDPVVLDHVWTRRHHYGNSDTVVLSGACGRRASSTREISGDPI